MPRELPSLTWERDIERERENKEYICAWEKKKRNIDVPINCSNQKKMKPAQKNPTKIIIKLQNQFFNHEKSNQHKEKNEGKYWNTYFKSNNGVKDPTNGNVYMSLFEAQLDIVFAVVDALYFDDIKVVVSETGWPSAGGDKEFDVVVENTALYNGNVVHKIVTGGGTYLRPNHTLNVFLFVLFNEN